MTDADGSAVESPQGDVIVDDAVTRVVEQSVNAFCLWCQLNVVEDAIHFGVALDSGSNLGESVDELWLIADPCNVSVDLVAVTRCVDPEMGKPPPRGWEEARL